ncbi:MAG: hypothetical protein QXZ71_02915, partial [Candidatus Caldarchaeum sp.]
VSLPVSIGVHRAKLLESTLHALGTFDFMHIFGESTGKTRDKPLLDEQEGLLGKAKKLFGA